MAEVQMGAVEQPRYAGVVQDRPASDANRRRIEQDEAELDALINGTAPQSTQADTAEDSVEAKPAEQDEKLTKEEQTYKKRYGDLRKHMNELNARIKELEKAPATSAQALTPPKSEADVEAWMRKYPDVAAIVEAIADKKASAKFASADDRLRRIDEMTAEAERQKHESEIRAVHSDFDDLRSSDEFHTWAEEQPKWVQDALYENDEDPRSVIKVIDLYKYENGLDTRGRKNAARNAASAVVTKRSRTDVDADGNGKTIYESQVSSMSPQEYEKRQDEIMEAIRSGNFVYDVSGGAR
jgi:hypothetical protein